MFATLVVREVGAPTAYSNVHKQYVMDLYRRMLRNSHNWNVNRNQWRADAQRIRAEFEQNRHVRNPRQLSALLRKAEKELEGHQHPDPYKRMCAPRVRHADRCSADLRPGNQMVRTACAASITDIPGSATCLYVACEASSTHLQPRLFSDHDKAESLKDQNV